MFKTFGRFHTRAQLAHAVDMSDEEDLLLAAAATVVICGYRHKRPSRYWMRPSLKLGSEHRKVLYKEMVFDDEGLLPQHISDNGYTSINRSTRPHGHSMATQRCTSTHVGNIHE